MSTRHTHVTLPHSDIRGRIRTNGNPAGRPLQRPPKGALAVSQHESGELPDEFNETGAARYLGVPLSTLHRWIHTGHVPAYRLGPRHVRVRRADLDALRQPIVPTRGDGGSAA